MQRPIYIALCGFRADLTEHLLNKRSKLQSLRHFALYQKHVLLIEGFNNNFLQAYVFVEAHRQASFFPFTQ